MTPNEFCEGIFNLNTRRFGTVAEIMMQKLLNLHPSKSKYFDFLDPKKNHKVEVKFSRAQEANDQPITHENLISIIREARRSRHIPFSSWQQSLFDCNIQQVKPKHFDTLYYGLFFSDSIQIFNIQSTDIITNSAGGKINFSDKQHDGNVGEGQFHLSNKTLQVHLDNYHFETLNYTKLLKLFK